MDPDGQGPAVASQQWTVYDGLNPYADFDRQGKVTYRYLYGPAVDMIMARLDSRLPLADGQSMARLGAEGDLAWYLDDHLGTVRDLADTAGQVIDHIAYDSFGGILAETNPALGDRFKFTAREFDAAIEQYYYRARDYDAAIGRFTSEDPLGLAGGDANAFRYVLNRPTVATDPTGLYDLDFHFYVIYFLLRAKGWPLEEAVAVATYSAYTDYAPETKPTTTARAARYHFPGCSAANSTYTGWPRVEDQIIPTARELQGAPPAQRGVVRAVLGIYLHMYADSFAHHGFTAFWSKSINHRPRDSGGNRLPLYWGHIKVGHVPDDPGYSEENLKWFRGATWSLYQFIPVWPGATEWAWGDVEKYLLGVYHRFMFSGEKRFVGEAERVRTLRNALALSNYLGVPCV